MDTCDWIITGGGSAGGVLAYTQAKVIGGGPRSMQ